MNMIWDWMKNTHHWWVENVWKPSWTKLLAWIYGAPAAIVMVFNQLGNWAGNTTVKDAIAQLHVPVWLPPTLVTVALLHFLAHGRSDDE